MMNDEALFLIIGAYVILAFLGGMWAAFMLRKRYTYQFRSVASFFILFSLALPGIGLILTITLVFYFKFYRHKLDEIIPSYINLDPFLLEFPYIKRQFGEGIAREIVENEKIPLNKRIAALTLLAEYRNRDHMGVIKEMLRSKNDELRLLSFSVIDKLEQDIHQKIQEQKMIFQDKNISYQQQMNAHKEMAFAYWELIYFDLSDETLTNYLISMIEEHALAYLKYKEESDVYVLLGKAALRKQDYDTSLAFFWKALELKGIDNIKEADYLIPYIAEIYYGRHKFTAVKKLLGNSILLELNPKMKPVREIWV